MQELIHGAKWWKFDFHNHTPASYDFGKNDVAHKKITPENWLLMYMRAGIDCVAITDHNSGEWIDKLKEALAIMKEAEPKPVGFRKLYLFPGVEISASGNTHILAIFDVTAGTSKIQALLGAVGFPADQFGTSEAVTEKSVELVINEIHKLGGVTIPAHVDKPCGLFIKQSGNTLKQSLSVEGLLAIELIDKSYNKPDIYTQLNLQLSEVIGTDSHISAQVGSNYTWIKMDEPSLDALKLALHDREDGVIRKGDTELEPNTITNRYFIKSLTVRKGFKAGNGSPLRTGFSPWLTSIIGGRGSGKSTIINYLRIALARIDDMPDVVQSEFNKFNKIGNKNSTGMLREDTSIEVEVFKDGVLYLIKWSNYTHTLQEYDNSTGDWSTPEIVSNIKELFPIQVFNQKELYELTGNPAKLIELIDSQFDKATWDEEKGLLITKWISKRALKRQLIKAISDETNIKTELRLVNSKITLLESSKYKETLDNFNKLTATSNFFTKTNKTVSDFITQIQEVKQAVPEIEINEAISSIVIDDSFNFVEKVNSALEEVKIKLTEASDILAPYKENLQEQLNALSWFQQFETAKEAYKLIAANFEESGAEDYETLIQKRTNLTEKINLIESQKVELETLNDTLETLYGDIIDKEKELRTKRNGVISRWEEFEDPENPFLIIKLQPMGDTDNANTTFRELIRKPGKEFSNNIYTVDEENEEAQGVISRIVSENEETRWQKREDEITEFISSTEIDQKNLDLRLARHLDSLKENTPEDIDRLLIWVPEDKLILKFKKDGIEEDIQSGSAGERTAGMLGLLLALNDIPLIIDQPEDDLDTKLISNFVVEGFKRIKQERQLVVVTHNPNIAVNANSDNVVHMDFQNGQVVIAGNNALQDKEIRNAVCEVMEGGREALNKRYFRISKALKN